MIGPILIFICALLWGSAFVAQKCGADRLGPFAVTFGRSVLAAAFLWGWARLRRGPGFTRGAWLGGALAGVALFAAIMAQQIGIGTTTPGISAFLTTNYILFVPILGIFCGRRASARAWLGAAAALVGSFFISVDPQSAAGFLPGPGELMTILCAVLFAVQILLVDRFAPGTDVIAFSCVQQVVCIVLAAPFLLLASERAHFAPANLLAALGPLAYLGIVSSGIAYTLQNLGQVRTPPAVAAVLMSLEAVFGALAGWVFFGDVLSARQLVGCAILFVAAASASVPASTLAPASRFLTRVLTLRRKDQSQ